VTGETRRVELVRREAFAVAKRINVRSLDILIGRLTSEGWDVVVNSRRLSGAGTSAEHRQHPRPHQRAKGRSQTGCLMMADRRLPEPLRPAARIFVTFPGG